MVHHTGSARLVGRIEGAGELEASGGDGGVVTWVSAQLKGRLVTGNKS